jgi:hypothetical protein
MGRRGDAETGSEGAAAWRPVGWGRMVLRAGQGDETGVAEFSEGCYNHEVVRWRPRGSSQPEARTRARRGARQAWETDEPVRRGGWAVCTQTPFGPHRPHRESAAEATRIHNARHIDRPPAIRKEEDRSGMTQVVIENPVINSPFEEPTHHFRFGKDGITDEVWTAGAPAPTLCPSRSPRRGEHKDPSGRPSGSRSASRRTS